MSITLKYQSAMFIAIFNAMFIPMLRAIFYLIFSAMFTQIFSKIFSAISSVMFIPMFSAIAIFCSFRQRLLSQICHSLRSPCVCPQPSAFFILIFALSNNICKQVFISIKYLLKVSNSMQYDESYLRSDFFCNIVARAARTPGVATQPGNLALALHNFYSKSKATFKDIFGITIKFCTVQSPVQETASVFPILWIVFLICTFNCIRAMRETTRRTGAFHLYPNLIKAETDRGLSYNLLYTSGYNLLHTSCYNNL